MSNPTRPSSQESAPKIEPADAFGLLRSYSRHLMFVRLALHSLVYALERRADIHDASKMLDDEFAGFSRINAAARIHKFGSPEYAEGMKREKPTIDLHFSRNRHHPERPSLIKPVISEKESDDLLYEVAAAKEEMNFLDIIEMVCDWWGAGKGYDSKMAWKDSVEMNLKNKGKYLSPEQLWLVHEVASFLGEHADVR